MTDSNDTRTIRPCGTHEAGRMLEIINAAAQAYRPVIPPDRWHDPYMPAAELEGEEHRAECHEEKCRGCYPNDSRRGGSWHSSA